MTQISNFFVELRSEEVNEILTRQPSWLVRWSASIIFLILALIGLGAWFTHYPEVVHTTLVLTNVDAPREVTANSESKLINLLVNDGAHVKQNSPLAYLESTANPSEVLYLKQMLDKAWVLANNSDIAKIKHLQLNRYHELGELQNDYQTFIKSYTQLEYFTRDGFYEQKKMLQQKELQDLQAIGNNLKEQLLLNAHDLKLAQAEFEVQKDLAAQKVIAFLDLKREESKFMARKLPYQQAEAAVLLNISIQHAKQSEILELNKSVLEQHDNFLQAIGIMQSAVRAWEAKYIVRSPISGKIHFSRNLQIGQQLKLQEILFFVMPSGSDLVGEMELPQLNSGKVKIGQKVLIKLNAYPYQEFGLVNGRIISIAEIPLKSDLLLAKVSLPNGLVTTHGKHLPYRVGMSASADILTNDRRLLERIFFQFNHLFNA